jgi:competence protein ComEC
MKSVFTRFRAYQLGNSGSSFSYCAEGHFTLLEGRMTEQSKPSLIQEMTICDAQTVDVLHISSWDTDHCRASELTDLLQTTRPRKIQCPGYKPYSDSAIKSQEIIHDYINSRRHSNTEAKIQYITPEYINGLEQAIELAYNDTFYNPIWIDPKCQNNNSTITHFRKGCYNLLSLGDVECPNISARLRRSRLLKLETDIMILAHHGADNGLQTKLSLND